jgi:hypothetical protein
MQEHHLSEHFLVDEAVEREVTAWFRQQPKEFYAAGFQGLVNDGTGASTYREIMLRNVFFKSVLLFV